MSIEARLRQHARSDAREIKQLRFDGEVQRQMLLEAAHEVEFLEATGAAFAFDCGVNGAEQAQKNYAEALADLEARAEEVRQRKVA